MTLVLRPLLNMAGRLVDELWTERMRKPVSLLLPDWADPLFPDPVGAAESEAEAALRQRLGALGQRVRELGAGLWVREVLGAGDGGEPDRQAVLLALPGAASWSLAGRRAWRGGADGAVYELTTTVAGGAAHAEHAVLVLAQRLMAGDAAIEVAELGRRCLSLACALRDTVVFLRTENELGLATEIARQIAPAARPAEIARSA